MLDGPINFLDQLSLLIEFSILFSFSYTEISIKFMLHQMYFKIEEVFAKKDIENFDSSVKNLTGFDTVNTKSNNLLQIMGRESLTSDNCNIHDLEDKEKKWCIYFKNKIVGDTHFFKRYIYIILAFTILLVSMIQSAINKDFLALHKDWNNAILFFLVVVLVSIIIRSIKLIYNSREVGELLFKPDGILNKLIKEYNKKYDEFEKEQKKEIVDSESTAKKVDYSTLSTPK